VRTGQFPFSINGRALGTGRTAGFVKIIADAATDRVVGMHISTSTLGLDPGRASRRWSSRAPPRTSRASRTGHPTLSEVVREAALALDKRSLNT
jgi:dihydrolipoamide dehydrogenase